MQRLSARALGEESTENLPLRSAAAPFLPLPACAGSPSHAPLPPPENTQAPYQTQPTRPFRIGGTSSLCFVRKCASCRVPRPYTRWGRAGRGAVCATPTRPAPGRTASFAASSSSLGPGAAAGALAPQPMYVSVNRQYSGISEQSNKKEWPLLQ